NACDHLSGFNVCNRYLVVLYYQTNRVSTVPSRVWGVLSLKILWFFGHFCVAFKRLDSDKKLEEMEDVKKKYNVT
ncbi:unnamed protein product, partial [Oppiella nova]